MKRFALFFIFAILFFSWGLATVRYQIFPHDLVQYGARMSGLSTDSGTRSSNMAELFTLSVRDADVVFIGDSLTERGPWQDVFPNLAVANRGVGSDTILDIQNRVDTVISTRAERAFLMAGINDLYAGRDPEQIVEVYFDVVEQLLARGLQVVVQSTVNCTGACTYQREVAELNGLIEAWADQNQVKFVDLNAHLSDENGLKAEFSFDGVHLSASGYAAWISALRPFLAE